MPTGIPYCDETWNPVIGCTKVAAGCQNCWAEKLHTQRHDAWQGEWVLAPYQYHRPFSTIQLLSDRLEQPLHWRKPRTIFVNSMSDTFHEDVGIGFFSKIYDVMRRCPQHTFQLFTKRYERAQGILKGFVTLPNVHLFFSASVQTEIDVATGVMFRTDVAVRGLSLEPLLEFVEVPPLDCIIVGCESGPNRRPCHTGWIRYVVNQCKRWPDTRVYVKQLNIDGKVVTDPAKFPADLRIREYPGKD